MRGRNDSRYEQFEISSETIEQELRPVVCEHLQTDRRTYTDIFKDTYSVDYNRL